MGVAVRFAISGIARRLESEIEQMNSDLAFQGSNAFIRNFNGFQICDISNPSNPAHRTAVVCPGGQGEVSVYQNLLLMSAERTRSRTDCGALGVPTGNPLRFRGVRVFDISNLDKPVQVAVQTCRGYTPIRCRRARKTMRTFTST